MAGSFSQKVLTYQLTLASGGSSTLTGLRSSCYVDNVAGNGGCSADIEIYGLTLSRMNALTTLGNQYLAPKGQNKIIVSAGDAGNVSKIYEGDITMAFTDAQSMPEVCFRIQSQGGYFAATTMAATPTAVPGNGDVGTVLQQIAGKMNIPFEANINITTKLSNIYLPGNYWTQFLELADHAGLIAGIDNGTAYATPPGQARQGAAGVVSKDTGMVGYPAFISNGIIVKMLFRPDLKMMGSLTVQSELTPANGQWQIAHLSHDLQSMMPHGRWFTIAECNNIGSKNPGDQGT